MRIYCLLAKAAEGEHTQARLAELAWLDKTTMVVATDEMERRGLAERRPSPTDRRVKVVAITAEGRRVLAAADAIVRGVYDEVLGDLPEADVATFVAVLEHLVAGSLAAPFHLEKRVRRRAQRAPARSSVSRSSITGRSDTVRSCRLHRRRAARAPHSPSCARARS